MNSAELDRCPSCQAPHGPSEAFCWMCHHRFWSETAAPPQPRQRPVKTDAPKPAAPPPVELGSGWTQPFLVAAFILILAGLTTGGGTGSALLWLGLTPALLITALAGIRAPKTEPTTTLGKIERFATKVASILLIMILVILAIIIALVAACFAIFAALK